MRNPHFESWRRLALFALLVIVCGLSPAHSQQPAALAIEGGTLVDGNGGTPARDSVVVIEGNKITKVSRKGQVTYPEAGRFELVVKNPEPLDPFYVKGMWGNGTSNVAHLIVNYKY